MTQASAQTIEQVLFQRMGVSIEDAVAVGTDFLDAQIANWSESGISANQRLRDLGQLIDKLIQPATLEALNQLLDQLPQLARLAGLAGDLPKLVATLADLLDEYQVRAAKAGIDLQKSLTNGLHALCWLSCQIDNRDLEHIRALLKSEIMGPPALDTVGHLANSISRSRQELSQSINGQKIGLFGLLKALRNPKMQRSLAFAVRVAECFGENLENKKRGK